MILYSSSSVLWFPTMMLKSSMFGLCFVLAMNTRCISEPCPCMVMFSVASAIPVTVPVPGFVSPYCMYLFSFGNSVPGNNIMNVD